MATAEASLAGLPDELLEIVLAFLPPRSLVAVQLASKRFVDLAEEPLLWRYCCQTEFRYWDAKHDIARKLARPASEVDWKQLFIRRMQIDRTVAATFESILSTQQGRVNKIETILEEGYDAKETLLRCCIVGDDAEDVLARRYYGNAVLATLHQTMAIEIWENVRNNEAVPLERALGSYDMFVLGTREGDYDDVARSLDALAGEVRTECPRFDTLTTRQKALALVNFVRARDLTGVKSMDLYSELRNNFIGIALLDSEHQSLPLISVAIYCCIAQRLGINAGPCGFPFHIYGAVYAPERQTLDGTPLAAGSDPDTMYVDPFRSDFEVPPDNLRSQLLAMGASPSTHAAFLRQATTRELVLRTGRNIMNSVHSVQQGAPVVQRNGSRIQSWFATFPDVDRAFYATLWATMLLSADADGHAIVTLRRRQYLPFLAEQFQTHCPWDASLIEQYIVPLLRNMPEHDRLLEIVHEIRRGDEMPRPVLRRDPESHKDVKYKIGQMFQHKRYGYEGVVIGWDPKCDATEAWIMQMGVDSLARGRDQSFYHVM